jgi:hypothetical protein
MKINYDDYGKDVQFSKIAEIAYSEFQAVVFALEIQNKMNEQ